MIQLVPGWDRPIAQGHACSCPKLIKSMMPKNILSASNLQRLQKGMYQNLNPRILPKESNSSNCLQIDPLNENIFYETNLVKSIHAIYLPVDP